MKSQHLKKTTKIKRVEFFRTYIKDHNDHQKGQVWNHLKRMTMISFLCNQPIWAPTFHACNHLHKKKSNIKLKVSSSSTRGRRSCQKKPREKKVGMRTYGRQQLKNTTYNCNQWVETWTTKLETSWKRELGDFHCNEGCETQTQNPNMGQCLQLQGWTTSRLPMVIDIFSLFFHKTFG